MKGMGRGEERALVDPQSTSYSTISRTTSFVQGRKVSFIASVFNLSNAILGAGILGLPYACSKSGLVLFTVLLIAIAIVADYSLFLLLWCARTAKKYTYEELGIQAFGRRGPYLVGAAILVQNLGQMVSYLVVVGDLLPEVMRLLIGKHSNSLFVQRRFLMVLVLTFIALPISMLRKLSFMSFASGFSFFCMILFAIVVLVKYPSTHIDDLEPAKLVSVSTATSLALPTMCFSFVCHTSFLPVFAELEEADRLARTPRLRNRMRYVSRISIFVALILYLIGANVGYATFGNGIQKDILKSYQQYNEHDALTIFIRVCFIISVTFTIPGSCFPFRKTIFMLVWGNPDYVASRHILVTLATMGLVLILALYVPAITTVFGVVGATSSVSLVFLLPSAIFLKIRSMADVPPIHSKLCVAMLVVGIAIGVISLGGMVTDWIQHGFH